MRGDYISNLKKIVPVEKIVKFLLSYFSLLCTLAKSAIELAQKTNPIVLKFGTHIQYQIWFKYKYQWLGNISNYLQEMIPICCHAYRANSICHENENQCVIA